MSSDIRSMDSTLFDDLPIGYQSLDADGRIVHVNPAWLALLGYDRDEILGRPLTDILDPDSHESFRENFSRLLDRGELSGVRHAFKAADGRTVTTVCDGRTSRDDDGLLTHCFLRDISDLVATETALRDSQERLRALSDASFEAIFLSDKGMCIDQNLTAEKMFGATLEDAIGRPGTDWIAPEDRDLVMNKMIEGIEDPYEATALRRDGTTFPCEIQGRMLDYRGTRVRVTSLRDITDRKRAERDLIETQLRNQAMVDAIPDLMFLCDRNGIHLDYYAQDDSHLLFAPEHFLGRSIHEIHPPEMAADAQRAIDGVLANGVTQEMEYEIDQQGETRSFEARAVACGGERVLFLIRDITEMKRLRAIETRAERLESAGRIAGQVAHDFNNLLAPLTGYPELIREELPPGHPALDFIDGMETAARQISEINQQLLTLGRRGHYNLEPLDLNTIVRQTLAELPRQPGSVTIECELSPDLMRIKGGGAQIHRALTNLLVNAVDAVDGSGTVRIETANEYRDEMTTSYGVLPLGEYARLRVSDTGCGIPAEAYDRIFEPFFTTKTVNKQRGSGLGLSVVDNVVRDHHGHVDVTSTPGEGTTFDLFFPITREEPVAVPPRAARGAGQSVLVVDDDEMQREVTVRLLDRLGYAAGAVESGEAAVTLLGQEERDLVILDMVMPGGIDGAETYRRILEVRPGQRAIIVSGFSGSERVREARELGAGAFVRKPLTLEELASAVSAELQRS